MGPPTKPVRFTFDKPGTYVLAVYAEDISLFSMRTMRVIVTGNAASSGQEITDR